ncbi:MAG: protein-L-isoaspartate O-methyltransferase [Rhodospirillales bacterium]|nr:protein-L-isoaspartate O-methyltransferase [Rhodospirillales bacterium]
MSYDLYRKNMVDGQVLPNRVTDPLVIDAMYEIPRENFVPKEKRSVAYIDEALEIGNGRYLLEPMVLARLLQAAEIQPDDTVLDVAGGTGYSSAVIAKIASIVVALESDSSLAETATATLNKMGLDNAVVVEGELVEGYAKQGPYNVIFINGAVGSVPETIVNQLAEGGRLVTITVGSDGVGRGTLIFRKNNLVSQRDLFDAGTPVLKEFPVAPKPFAF